MIQGITLFDFQSDASEWIKRFCSYERNKNTLVVKAPTGSGKTIILLDFIDQFNYEKNYKVSYIWLTPGSGELEEQSKNQMIKRLPQYTAKDIDEALSTGFDDKDVCFINWERVTKKGNRAIIESERKNLFERIREAHLEGTQFILIIDEEHSNNTSKAKDIIDAFAPKYTIRVSATAQRNNLYEYYEIDESRVISSGLITKAIYINDGLTQKSISDENMLLLNLSNNRRREIRKEYQNLGLNINPLVIIQFPNERAELIRSIEEKLEDLDVSYDNGKLAIWMSTSKRNIDTITKYDDKVQFLLIKQAISVGWDCPRAKILVKLRENMSEDFEIQTIGRIRRMPEAKHYDNQLLDNAFLYTFDEKYKNSVIENIGNAYDIRRIFLKKEYKDFRLVKQLQNKDMILSDEREVRKRLREYFVNKYHLDEDKDLNRKKLIAKGFVIGSVINSTIVKDQVRYTSDLTRDDTRRHEVEIMVNTHNHGIDLKHEIDRMKSYIGMTYEKTRVILEMLFRDSRDYYGQHRVDLKLLDLTTSEFYAFIINNADKLRSDFKEGIQGSLIYFQNLFDEIKPREVDFRFPEEDVFRYVPQRNYVTIGNNVYDGYTDECLTDSTRSLPERLFERWAMKNAEWYFKNGDSGQQYFSIVYVDGARKQHLFYADYILQIKGKIWIIETKGGETSSGVNKNIDINIENKFYAFKEYAEKYGVKWGFVRDKNENLYINNTKFSLSLDDDNWKRIDMYQF